MDQGHTSLVEVYGKWEHHVHENFATDAIGAKLLSIINIYYFLTDKKVWELSSKTQLKI